MTPAAAYTWMLLFCAAAWYLIIGAVFGLWPW